MRWSRPRRSRLAERPVAADADDGAGDDDDLDLEEAAEPAHVAQRWLRATPPADAPPPAPLPPGRGGDQRIPRPATARLGDPPPWNGITASQRRVTATDVRAALSRLGPPAPSERELDGTVGTASAVLAPIYDHDGEAHVVLTRRTWELRSHQGEVSFPGGRQEADETVEGAALREAQEEIGLDPATVEIVGELDHLATFSSRSFIVPLVGVLAARPSLEANPAEVAAILHVPLSDLLDPAIYREERWQFLDADRPIFFFELVGDTVWGATAAMLRQLLGFITGTVVRGGLLHP